jgi:hypothetical protein
MLPVGTAVCWQAARKQTALRGRIIAVVQAGTAPAQAAPELLGLKTTQVKFGDPSRPRRRPHYLIKREEENHRGARQSVYYLPPATSVETVRGAA